MKHHKIHKYILLAFLSSLAGTSIARIQEEKRKLVDENFSISDNTEVEVSNRFGRIDLRNWDKKEVEVKVEIIARGKSDEKAQKILDNIRIEFNETSELLSIASIIDGKKSKSSGGKDGQDFEINYSIKVPAKNDLILSNSFGDITMEDRTGRTKVDLNYGSLRAGELSNSNRINISFGKGSIAAVRDGNMELKYSSLELLSATTLELEQGFSNIELGDIGDLELESKYGEVEIEKVKDLKGEAHFSGFQIENLTSSLDLECSYLNDFEIEELSSDFKFIKLEGKFTSLELHVPENINSEIEVEMSFGTFRYDDDIETDFNYKVKESNKSIYRGKIGKGDPYREINVDLSYGNFRLKKY
ncbi:MAG: hypothetical protein AAF789_12195 [Bacteroidota bacterium]